jgi:TFIIF-interacting CTD phosphatase-like protein
MTVIDNNTTTYVVYLENPVKSQEYFKAVWENHFGFLPETLYFAEDLCSVACELNSRQVESLTNVGPLTINRRKVRN